MEEKINPENGSQAMDINADSDIPGNTHLSNPDAGTDALERALQELEEERDKYRRLLADFDNFKKRSYKERVELSQTAGKEILVSLLEVMDDMERAEKLMDKIQDPEQIKEGNKLVFSKLRNKLLQRGLKPMDSLGEAFNDEKHEAVTMVDAGPEKKGVIIDELEKGYYLNDKIVRFAKVVVGQ